MKLSKVQSPKSRAQKDASIPRTSPGLGRGTLGLGFGGSDRDGVALVITLIMLSIITFMAVTFLVLSQRERESVTGATDQKIARNASDAALARVSAELLTRIMLKTNFQDFDLMVSTNYINNNGFIDGIAPDPRNVNYDHETNQISFTGGPVEMERNIANLLYNPRAPVFVETNTGTHQSEFRFYRDENRNGRFDKNGNWPVIVNDLAGNPKYLSTNATGQYIFVSTNPPVAGWILSNNFTGDPEWIGQLERPAELHSADNRFIARYAYLVVPVGKTLDVNYAHNRAKRISPTGEGFLRNQGVGTWEINLAGFLADLNTNAWWNSNNATGNSYTYSNNLSFSSSGPAFADANAILNYRYGTPIGYRSLNSANQLFPNAAALADIDVYSDGPLMLGTTNPMGVPDGIGNPWSGADTTNNPNNHFFSTQDIFSQMPPGFQATLGNLGTSNDSYNEYTFSRMVAQLGTDSAPDRGKININFKNTDQHGNVIPGLETNLAAWPSAIDFFTNAAAAMFRQLDLHDFNGNLVTVTNIPIYEDPAVITTVTNLNYYTPAVHRILQLAANMYDVTTNRFINGGPTNYPSVLRPVFSTMNGMVTIVGYREVTDLSPLAFPTMTPTNFLRSSPGLPLDVAVNLYGVPWVIGAKKGFPNFNEFSMNNPLVVTRKLQFTNSVPRPPWTTNQIFDFSISNSFGLEAWNSYTNTYARPLRLVVSNELSILLSTNAANTVGGILLNVQNRPYGNDISLPGWAGWSLNKTDNSFLVPLVASETFTNGIYRNNFPVIPLNPAVWSATFVPHLFMTLENKVKYILIDTSPGVNRIVDYVSVDKVEPMVDIAATLYTGQYTGVDTTHAEAIWNPNLIHGSEYGILSQIEASKVPNSGVWTEPSFAVRQTQANFFNSALLGNAGTNNFQAPYTPSATVLQSLSWQANDPLVHYLAPDITSTNGSFLAAVNRVSAQYVSVPVLPLGNLTNLNWAYQPWGGNHLPGGSPLQDNKKFDYNVYVKDAGVQQSDNWDFPTNRLPTIGWLGRVHRGTPWQTVDMKSANLSQADWTTWNNDNVYLTNGINGNSTLVDAGLTHPTADYGLFDLFTASVNENATYGQLSVNQTNLAAWSGVLSDVAILTNSTTGAVGPSYISPAGVYDPNPTNMTPVAAIVNAINATRANTNNQNGTVLTFPNGFFQHAGDVLATPQLSVASPFLNTAALGGPGTGLASLGANGINDEIMERIPQQIMSLLTLNQTPRFVVYSYGQTLHPADHSLVSGGTFNGLCTNYQITAESATRAVVRVEGTADSQYVNGKVDSLGRSYPPHIVVEQFNVLGPD